VVDAVTVITTHLGELIRQHAFELLGRAETKRLMDALNESHPKLVEELVPKLLTLGEVGRVLEQLLRERVSIRDLGSILEALIEIAPMNKSVVALVEGSRQAIGRRLIRPLLDGDGQLPVLLLDPALEEEILATLAPENGQRLLGASDVPAVPLVRRLTDSLRQLIGTASAAALPVLLAPGGGALSPEALAGTGFAAASRGFGRGDSSRDPSAPGRNGALRVGKQEPRSLSSFNEGERYGKRSGNYRRKPAGAAHEGGRERIPARRGRGPDAHRGTGAGAAGASAHRSVPGPPHP
jgi:hypothetical protein